MTRITRSNLQDLGQLTSIMSNQYPSSLIIVFAATLVSFIYELLLLSWVNNLDSQGPDTETLDEYISCSQDPVYQRALNDVIRYETWKPNDGETGDLIISIILAAVSIIIWLAMYHCVANLVISQQTEMLKKFPNDQPRYDDDVAVKIEIAKPSHDVSNDKEMVRINDKVKAMEAVINTAANS